MGVCASDLAEAAGAEAGLYHHNNLRNAIQQQGSVRQFALDTNFSL
jgi:hypothetical protein